MLVSDNSRLGRWAYAGIMALALLLRIAMFPHQDETRDVDEVGYISGSLAMIEGLPPGYKAAPAGPNLWLGWLYLGGVSAVRMIHPDAEARAVPLEVRPFIVINEVLFDHYRDLTHLHELWILAQLVMSMWAVSAAFNFGCTRGGLAGGILIGGSLATLPLFVEFTDMSRPYMTAWAFGVLSLNAAISAKPARQVILAGIFLGLAIATRIEMLLLAPLVLWELWDRPQPGRLLFVWARLLGIALITTLLVAPWLITHLIGNLRTIATVRLGPNPLGATTFTGVLAELAWSNGLAGPMLGFIAVCVALLVPSYLLRSTATAQRHAEWLRIACLTAYTALLLATLGHGTVFLQQQGPVILALIFFSGFGAMLLGRAWPAGAPWIAAVFLLLPISQSHRTIREFQGWYAPDPSTAWVEAHVPAGTIVYVQPGLRNLLPTPQSASVLWRGVTDDEAGRLKFQSGLSRFKLSAEQIPRALSDENLAQERGSRRGIFILGSRTNLPDPRFDLRYFNASPVFDVQDIVTAFEKTGGVVVIHNGLPNAKLGTPILQSVSPSGGGTYVYCSPDVVARLKP